MEMYIGSNNFYYLQAGASFELKIIKDVFLSSFFQKSSEVELQHSIYHSLIASINNTAAQRRLTLRIKFI